MATQARQINAEMVLHGWSSKLRMRALGNDPYAKIRGNYDPNAKTIPDGVGVNVTAASGETDYTISLINPLDGSGVTGRTEMNGNEDSTSFRSMKLYADLVGNALKYNKYGLEAHEDKVYALLSKYNGLIADWHREIEGKYTRQSICERYSVNVSASPDIPNVSPEVNSNILVPNAAGTALTKVAYNTDAAIYAGNLNTVFTAGAGHLTTDLVNQLDYQARSVMLMDPVTVGGMEGFVLMVPSSEAALYRNPSNTKGLLELNKYTDVKAIFGNTYLGSYGSVHLFEDFRSPTATIAAGSTTFAYRNPGRGADGRDAAAADVANVGILMGKGAFYKYQMEALHWKEKTDDQNYKRNPGIGAFATYGYANGEFDIETGATAGTRVNDSSALVMFKSLA